MEIVSEHVHRVLAYVEALNRHGAKPRRDVVNAFAERPDRKGPRRSTAAQRAIDHFLVASLSQWKFDTLDEGEAFTQYLDRLGWIERTEEVELTPVGRALLKALNSPVLDEAASDVFEIVLEPNDPFAYAQALGAL